MTDHDTDRDLDEAIARALSQSAGQGLAALAALRDRVEAERAPRDPGLGRIWDALVEAASRTPSEVGALLRHAEGRARWRALARGPAHPETIEAWEELGEIADQECAWDAATRAWEAIAGAPLDDRDPATRPALSRALRGLGGRRLAAARLDEARALFERDLAVNELVHPTAHPQLALSLGNLALVLERLGARGDALAARRRQRDVLAASGAAAGLVAAVDADIARLA